MANYLKDADLAKNPATRVPICLCLDLSGSMDTVESGDYKQTGMTKIIDGQEYDIVEGGATRRDELQKGIKVFYDAIKEDEMAVDAADICVITFHDKAECVIDFAHIEKQTIPELITGGSTNMGEGVLLALTQLEERKNAYKAKGIQYFQPWLVLMTDGENNGSNTKLQDAISKVTTLESQNKLTVFCIGIGKDADMNTLAQFSNKREPLRLQGLKFKEFFEWLSQSVSRTSVSKISDTVELPSPKGWGTL